MRLYLSADIEGTCGIADWAETERATMDDYRPFAAQMTAEVAAACEGAVAAGAEDTGVIIAFNSEAEAVTDSLMIPAGTRTLAINPLNWKTDGTPAGKEENLGACFTDYSGNIVTEIPQLTGAYLDPVRGALKVTDVTPEEYPPVLSLFSDGVYHLYDYQFFYRNLQENVAVRLDAYLASQAA